MAEIISVKNLVKKYKGVTAVDGLSLSIQGGELYSLLGENGAGKTTTVKILCDLLSYDSGEVLLFNKSYKDSAQSIKADINLSPQETAVAKNLSVYDNVMLIASLYGIEKRQAKQRTDEIIEKLKLEDVKSKRAKTLSGGMQRRLSIAMSLVTNPKILFLDEPTLGLDVRARRELWKIIKNLKGMVTIILTTHYMEEAEALSDRVGIMKDGKLITEGAVEEIKAQTNAKNLEDAFLKITGDSENE